MEIILTEQFEKSFAALSGTDKEHVLKSLLELEENPRLPGLRVKKMADKRGIWEARASRKVRFTFERLGNVLTLRHVGQHDPVLDNP